MHGTEEQTHAVGVLFVHRIGVQRRGQTLSAWTDPMLEWLRHATRNPVILTDADLAPRGQPPHVVASLSVNDAPQSWLIAEGFWAQSFEAPSFRELWAWGLPVIPATLASHLATTNRRLRDRAAVSAGGTDLRKAAAGLLGWLGALLNLTVVAPLLIMATTLLLLLSLVPSRRFRTWVGSAQRLLVLTVGDSQSLIESPTLRAAITSEVHRAILFLEARCSRVVVVAHSQGAAIAHAALALPSDDPMVRSFVSVGSGLNKLSYLQSVRRRDPHSREDAFVQHWLPFLSLCMLIGSTVALFTLNWSGLLVVVLVTNVAAILWWAYSIFDAADVMPNDPGAGWAWLQMYLSLGAVLGAFIWALIAGAGPYPLMIVLGFAGLVGGVSSASTEAVGFIEPDLVGSVDRWLDLWATRDPVPNGSTLSAIDGWPDSRPITGSRSRLRDHVGYSANLDECIPLVCYELLHAAGDELALYRSVHLQAESFDRLLDLFWLRTSRMFAMVAAVVLALRTWPNGRERSRSLYCEAVGCSAAPGTGATAEAGLESVEAGEPSGWLPERLFGWLPHSLSDGSVTVLTVGGYLLVLIGALGVIQIAWSRWAQLEGFKRRSSNFGLEEDQPWLLSGLVGCLVWVAVVGLWPTGGSGWQGIAKLFGTLMVVAFASATITRPVSIRARQWFKARFPKTSLGRSLAENYWKHAAFLDRNRPDSDQASLFYGMAYRITPEKPGLLRDFATFTYQSRHDAAGAERLHRAALRQTTAPCSVVPYVGFLIAESRDEEAMELLEPLRPIDESGCPKEAVLEVLFYKMVLPGVAAGERQNAQQRVRELLEDGVRPTTRAYIATLERTAPTGTDLEVLRPIVDQMTSWPSDGRPGHAARRGGI